MFGGGARKLEWGTLTQLRPDEFGMRQRPVNILLQIRVLSFCMDFVLKFGGENQKK